MPRIIILNTDLRLSAQVPASTKAGLAARPPAQAAEGEHGEGADHGGHQGRGREAEPQEDRAQAIKEQCARGFEEEEASWRHSGGESCEE